ncbi:FtsJ-like methyltransferase-domain-containing protein [Lactifluus volemus]|nr:FtsJ-like methyltransferase-domain-containing protein [Lactifluus volemus]
MFTTVARSLAKSLKPSSKRWLADHFDDPYVRQRLSHPAQYRSRSAFKLLEIDDRHRRFLRAPDVRAVVDLGAAPGGWSQVAAGFMGWRGETWAQARSEQRFDQGDVRWGLNFDAPSQNWSEGAEDGKAEAEGRGVVIAVDRLRITPIPGVHTLQADFLAPETALMVDAIIRAKANPDGKADVILSDMAANATGNRTHDTQDAIDICHAVWDFTRKHLRTAQSLGRSQAGSCCSNISNIQTCNNSANFTSTQTFIMYCMSNRTLAGLPRERPIGCVLASKERLEYGS